MLISFNNFIGNSNSALKKNVIVVCVYKNSFCFTLILAMFGQFAMQSCRSFLIYSKNCVGLYGQYFLKNKLKCYHSTPNMKQILLYIRNFQRKPPKQKRILTPDSAIWDESNYFFKITALHVFISVADLYFI